MTNQLLKAIQQSREDEDAREPRPRLRGIASLIYSDNGRQYLEPLFAYEQKDAPHFGKGIEGAIEIQKQINARRQAFGLDPDQPSVSHSPDSAPATR